VREGVASGKLGDFFAGIVLAEDLVDIDLVHLLEDGQFSVVGGEDGLEAGEFVEEMGIMTEIVNSISVEDDYRIVRQVFDEEREKLLHVAISTQSRTDNPAIDCLLPALQLGRPLEGHFLHLFLRISHLLFRNEDRVHYNFWGV
jgi:hypothetical protein